MIRRRRVTRAQAEQRLREVELAAADCVARSVPDVSLSAMREAPDADLADRRGCTCCRHAFAMPAGAFPPPWFSALFVLGPSFPLEGCLSQDEVSIRRGVAATSRDVFKIDRGIPSRTVNPNGVS